MGVGPVYWKNSVAGDSLPWKMEGDRRPLQRLFQGVRWEVNRLWTCCDFDLKSGGVVASEDRRCKSAKCTLKI